MPAILCVDNNETIRKVVKDSVKDLGYDFYEAVNGKEMLNVLDNDLVPDLIIIDWSMPVMSGKESIIKIRENKNFKDTTILVMINVLKKDQVMDAIDVGANYYVLKPFNVNGFQAEIKRIIEKSAG
ncbi:hypothetical protein CI105_04755 [Candidatus Izimaplasma bacterium ZiA1]|uniref:response regulator n=1 Tax=Candidatus Izimoplasma sp. ZiA1 TaxID=2024899 RepID=UPI000BAA5E74|nr:hypothetical protein CI105_04755 [Candidatus Izimaplasma bacterium ZiA1]